METIVTKSYQGAQTRLLLPKVKDVAGVIGDNNATRLCFKLPKTYATGWQKFVEFDCYVVRDGEEVKPTYVLDENNSILIPYEITESNVGKEVDYNLKLVSQDGEVVEKSEIGTLYFRDSSNGTFVDPDPYTDVVTFLYNNAFCNVSYSDGTSEGDDQLPKLTFTPMNSEGEAEEVSLNIPYLDENGYILNKFINKEIVVEVFRIATPGDLTSLTEAQVPDMALLSEWEPTEPNEQEPLYYMDLYMLVGPDPTVASNWYLIHTDNPTFKNVSTTGNVDIAGTLDVGGDVTIGNHTTGSPDTHATLTVNGDVHVDSDKKIFVDTIQSQTDANPITINDNVTLASSMTLKTDRIESSTGDNLPVTVNDDLAIGTGLQNKSLKIYGTTESTGNITGRNGLDITGGNTNLQNTSVGDSNQGANLQVFGNTSLSGTLKTDTIASYNNANPVTINDETVIGADGGEKSLYVYGTTNSTDKITGNNGLEITSGDTDLKDTNIGDENTASNFHVYGETTLDGDVTIDDDVALTGNVTLTGDVTQTGNTDLSGTLKTDTITSHTQEGNISVNTGIDVVQNKTVTADTIHVDTIASRASGANDAVTIDDKLNITGDIQQDGNNVSASLKNTTVTGTLGVSDQTTTNTLTVTNGSSLNTVTASGVVDLASTLKVDTVQSHTDDKPVTVDDRLEVGTSNGDRSFKVFGAGEVTGDTTIGGDATIAGDTTIGTAGSNNTLIVRGTVDAGGTTVTSLVTPSITGSNSNPVSITSGASISGNVSLPDYSSNSLLTTNSSSEVTAVGFGSTGYVLTGGGNSISWQEPSDDLTEQGGIHVASTGGLYTLQMTKAPNDHADTTMKYGHATPAKYGHVKFDQTVASNRQTYSPIGKFPTTSAYVGYYIEDVTQPSGYKLITESNKDSSGIDVNNTVAYLNDTSLMTISEEGIKDFVNSSIGTATANFLGTFKALDDADPQAVPPKPTSIYSFGWSQSKVDTMVDPYSVASEDIATELANKMSALGVTPSPNDYIFVEMDFTTPTTSPDEYRRYKYNSSTGWEYEYTLNNSSFTEAQWNAIDSGITALKVAKLNGLPNYAPSMPSAAGPIGGDLKPVYVNNSGQITEVANNLVSTSGDQNIANKKTFTGQIWAQNTIRLAPASNIRRGIAFLKSNSTTEETVIGKNSDGTTVKFLTGEPTEAGLNDGTIPSIGYINDYQKATYLVHRSGNEIVAGQKTFTSNMTIDAGSGVNPLTIKGNVPYVTFTNTSCNLSTGTFSQYITPRFVFSENNGYTLTNIGTYVPDANRSHFAIETFLKDTSGSTLKQASFNLRAEKIDNAYVDYGIISYRGTPTENMEILTLGNGVSLTTAQTITGRKTYTYNPLKTAFALADNSNKWYKLASLDIANGDSNADYNGTFYIRYMTSLPSVPSDLRQGILSMGIRVSTGGATPTIVADRCNARWILLAGGLTPDELKVGYKGTLVEIWMNIPGNSRSIQASLLSEGTRTGNTTYPWVMYNTQPADGVATLDNTYTWITPNIPTTYTPDITVNGKEVINAEWVRSTEVDSTTNQSKNGLVHNTGDETIQGRKTFSLLSGENNVFLKDPRITRGADTASVRRNYLCYTDVNGDRVAIIGHEKRVPTEDGVRVTNTGITNFYDGTHYSYIVSYADYNSSSNSYSYYTRASYRKYNASNTNDVVTIGSLQASTDVVHTSGNEIIAGYKTFTNNIKLTIPASPTIEMRNTTYSTSDATFNDWHGGIFNYDNNGNYAGIIGWIRYGDDIEHLKLRAQRVISNSTVNSEIDVRVYNDGTCCAMAPARAYANAGNQQSASDIITKWHLEQAITIGGQKTFTGQTILQGGVVVGTPSVNASFEIYHSTPYIDFHYNRSSLDYTARVVNNADGNLLFVIKDTSNNTATMNLSSSGYLQVPSPAPTTSATRNITISDQAPSGGNNGDIWIQYEV